MFQLADLRETRVWQEAYEEGFYKGLIEGRALARRDFVRKLLANCRSVKEVAQLMDVSVAQVKRLAKDAIE